MTDTDSQDTISLEICWDDGSLLDTIALFPGDYIIGRSDDADIVCEGSQGVSRHHAKLVVSEANVFVEDLNSTMGIMVNNQVTSKTELLSGDELQIANFRMIVRFPEADGGKWDHDARVVKGRSGDFDFGEELEYLATNCDAIKREVGKIIVGQDEIVHGVLVAILSQNHCLLVGVPGLAKTVMVRTFSKVLGLDSKRIQFTPDLMPTDIIGSEILKNTTDGNPTLQFAQGPVFTQFLLADEINRTPPKTQAALLEAMQEHQVTVAMKSYRLPSPFCVIATQNPIEQEGTYPLPEAQQDRFMLCLDLEYPDFSEEMEIMTRTTIHSEPECHRLVDPGDVIRFQRTVRHVGVPEEQVELAVRLTRATRPKSDEANAAEVSEFIDWGSGPRAGQALIRGAKATAAIEGRAVVAATDILELAPPVLRHRLCCNYKARSKGIDEDEIIRRIVAQTKGSLKA